MRALFVYAATKYQIDDAFERWSAQGQTIERLEAGEHLLAPGIYRIGDGVEVTQLGAGTTELVPVPGDLRPEEKDHWPDPPKLNALSQAFGVPEPDIVGFLGGAPSVAVLASSTTEL